MNIQPFDSAARQLAAQRAAAPVQAPVQTAPVTPAAPQISAVTLAVHAAASQQQAERAQSSPAQEQFISAARQLRQALGPMADHAPRFMSNPGTDEVQLEIVDETTGEVVRQIPEETIRRFAETWDAYLGALVDEQV